MVGCGVSYPLFLWCCLKLVAVYSTLDDLAEDAGSGHDW